MFFHQFDGSGNAFTDRDRRHDDNEFFEAVEFVQLKNGAQIDIRFPCARFHFYRKVWKGVRRTIFNQRAGFRHLVAELNSMQVFQ